MSNHTPGPWTVVDGHYPGFLDINGPSFKISIITSASDLDFNDFLKRSADAHLIAAAPELLEALEMAMEIGDQCSRGFLGKFQAKARAAIAKARVKS